jgi:uncharacterized membrane protein
MRARWWAIVLGVSVALNLFFIGWYGARVLSHREVRAERAEHAPAGGGPRHAGQRQRPFDWMSESERAELRPRRKGLRSARRDAEQALRAEPFDAERLRRALGVLRTETDAIQGSVHEYMVRRASAMDAAGRQHLADKQWGPERGSGRAPEHLRRGPERGPEAHERSVNDER